MSSSIRTAACLCSQQCNNHGADPSYSVVQGTVNRADVVTDLKVQMLAGPHHLTRRECHPGEVHLHPGRDGKGPCRDSSRRS
jgi:hypothetical protein